jgi:type III pantothenate kinase
MNLIIDIGNTVSKIGVLSDGVVLFKGVTSDKETLEAVLVKVEKLYPAIQACILATVKEKNLTINALLKQNYVLVELDSNTPVPIINKYGSPQTLGPDRLAAAVGASYIFKNANVLVVDIGTCMTFDFVNQQGEYLGGAISPGMDMRYKALHEFTSKLPEVKADGVYTNLIGTTTIESIRSGVQGGMVAEINGVIEEYTNNCKELKVILTGGHCDFFVKKLKNTIFVAPDLVLEGLNIILNHNV